jgi:hypothetical protein
MFGKKALPIGVMVMLPVVALAALGVGYGLWSEVLTIEGSVMTGEVDVGFTGPWIEEGVDVGGTYITPEPGNTGADCQAEVLKSSGGDDNGFNLLRITVTGAYPSYHCKVGFGVENLGTVPVLVYQPVPSGAVEVPIVIESCYADGVQVEQGQPPAECRLDIHFTNDSGIDENSMYEFAYTVEARQWNEPR